MDKTLILATLDISPRQDGQRGKRENAMSPDDQAELGGTQTSWKIPKW